MNKEHVIQVGFTFDEDAIIKAMVKSLQMRLESEIESGVRNDFFGGKYCEPKEAYAKALTNWLDGHKEEIIEKAAEKLTEKLWRTKPVKEMISKLSEETE